MSLAEQLVVDSSSSAEQRNRFAIVHRRQLGDVASVTTQWRDQGAGIGRTDRVLEARVATHLDRLVAIDGNGDEIIDRESMNSADADLRKLFSAQLEFHRHGTAEVYDLARTWRTWRDLHTTASVSPGLVTEEQTAERNDALQKLQGVADRTHDRRGRIAADVTFVQLLVQLNDVDALSATGEPSRSYLQ